MTRLLRFLCGIVLVLVGLAPTSASAAAVPTAPQPARQVPATAGSCVSSGGVWVLVIRGDGTIVVQGCTSNPSTGAAALNAVASVTERPSEQGFVCRINGVPDQCTTGSDWTPTTPTWRYSHALPGKSWVYSNLGYTSRTPPAGSLEGWCLSPGPCEGKLAQVLDPAKVSGPAPAPPPTLATTSAPGTQPATKAPSTQPSATRPATSQPPATRAPGASTTARTTAPATAASTGATASAPASNGIPGSPSSPSAPSSPATSTGTSSTSPSSTATSDSPATPVVANQPSSGGGGGTPWAAIGTGAAIAAAAGAFALVRVRRTVDDPVDELD